MVQMLIADHHFAMVPFRFHLLESRGGSCQNKDLFQSLTLESDATLRALETIPDTENESIQSWHNPLRWSLQLARGLG